MNFEQPFEAFAEVKRFFIVGLNVAFYALFNEPYWCVRSTNSETIFPCQFLNGHETNVGGHFGFLRRVVSEVVILKSLENGGKIVFFFLEKSLYTEVPCPTLKSQRDLCTRYFDSSHITFNSLVSLGRMLEVPCIHNLAPPWNGLRIPWAPTQ